jgi:hypothetical protein
MVARPAERFVVCVANAGYETSLQRNKIYAAIADRDAADVGDIRIIDETGEDYLYPAEWFIAIDVPDTVQKSVLQAAG